MGERKVINRYIPHDFDPSLIPRVKRDRSKLTEVRMMLPFSLQCLTCGEYMYRGKKFNSKKEDLPGEDYLGVRKFRFYIKCSVCSAEITFKTDPKNSDYEMERGAKRNFELWRDTQEAADSEAKAREEDDKNVMKALENRTLDSKVEMDILDALDEIKAINQRHERVDTNALLAALEKQNEPARDERLNDDEIDSLMKISKRNAMYKALDSEDDDDAPSRGQTTSSAPSIAEKLLVQTLSQAPAKAVSDMPVVVKKKRKIDIANAPPSSSSSALPKPEPEPEPKLSPKQEAEPPSQTAAVASFFDYGGSGSDSD